MGPVYHAAAQVTSNNLETITSLHTYRDSDRLASYLGRYLVLSENEPTPLAMQALAKATFFAAISLAIVVRKKEGTSFTEYEASLRAVQIKDEFSYRLEHALLGQGHLFTNPRNIAVAMKACFDAAAFFGSNTDDCEALLEQTVSLGVFALKRHLLEGANLPSGGHASGKVQNLLVVSSTRSNA